MKIKKIYNGVVPNGKILNSKNTSQNDTYSCSYINEKLLDNYSTEEQIFDKTTFRKYGKLVVVSGWFVLNSDSGTFTAPYKPLSSSFITTNGINNNLDPLNVNGYITFYPTGEMSIKMTAPVTFCTANFCYITND